MGILTLLLCIAFALTLAAIWGRSRHQIALLDQRLLVAASDHKVLESKNQWSEALRDAVLQAVLDGVMVLDGEQYILHLNPAAEDLFGKGIIGKTLMSVSRHYELDNFVREHIAGTSADNTRIVEIQNRLVRVRISTSQKDNNVLYILLLHDETELTRLARARRDMIANISHELRTPITTISLLADTLISGDVEKGRRRKMLKNILQETMTLTQLVEEMRYLSKIESGQMPIKLMAIPLTKVVHMALETMMPLAERKKQQLSVEIPDEWIVLADSVHVERVIKNIVHNAIKYTPDKGQITLSATVDPSGEEVIISVSDTGSGIDAEHQSRIFERFFQVDNARTDGTGLGLAIARHIVLAHGGRVWLESELGKGSTFFFTLQLAQGNKNES